jgi:hypothetical protein
MRMRDVGDVSNFCNRNAGEQGSWCVGGAVGGLTGALIGMGIPEYGAKRYEARLTKGGILLSVHSDNSDWTKRAEGILERTEAEDIGVGSRTKRGYRTHRPAYATNNRRVVSQRVKSENPSCQRLTTQQIA